MKVSKKFWFLLISFFVAGTAFVFACWGGDWDETEGSAFTPEIINKPEYEPFFRTTNSPFYGGVGYDTNWNRVCNELNIEEWNKFFDGKLGEQKLNYWL